MPRFVASFLSCLLLLAAAGPSAGSVAGPGITGETLRAPSRGAGGTLFTTLPAESTGVVVENRYADPTMWSSRYREFTLGAIGTGVATADYDNDGWVDLFVVSKTETSRLFRNRGDWTFEDVTDRAGLHAPSPAWSQGAAFADVDNDGHLDLYVCRYNAPNLLFINQGDGTFREEAKPRGLDLVDASGMASFADYDRDGWLDVYVQTNALNLEARPNGQPDRLFRNVGEGRFEDVTPAAGIKGDTQGHSATWWDYNEDGWPDLYVANDFVDPDSLYRNNRDGTFTPALSWALPHTPHSSMGADLGDVNNDGHLDLFVADMAATTREKDFRGMAKVRHGLLEPSGDPRSAPQYMHNALYLGTGTKRVWEAAFLAGLDATDWTWSVRWEDLDNDGWLDLHVTNGMVRELHHADVVARMMANESQAERIRLMRHTPRLDERNLAYRNRGDLAFENVSATWGLAHAGVSFAAAFADFDRDGDLDLVFSNYESGPTLCRNDAPSGHRLLLDLRGTRSNRYGVGARVELESANTRQVRELVLARGYLGSSEPMLHFGLGTDATVNRLTIRWPSGHVQTIENLPAGHRYTVTEPDADSVFESALRPTEVRPQFEEVSERANLQIAAPEPAYDEFRRQPLLSVRQNPLGPAAAVADLDGDGWDDLAIGGTTGRRGQLLSNLGDGQYLAYGSSVFGDNPRAPDAGLLLFEANGDGHPDLWISKGGVTRPPGNEDYAARLYLNDGDGRFPSADPAALPHVTLSAGPTAAADFDRDGDLDVLVGGRGIPGSYPTPASSRLLENEAGRFREVTAERAPALQNVGVVNAALWSDFDQDGWIDLLLAREWQPVLVLRNNEGTLTDVSDTFGATAAGSGFWQSIAAADFNGDGRLDYAVGNRGLNTRYHASPAQPWRLFRGEIGGRHQAIEAAYGEDGVLYPLLGRDQLLPGMPALSQRFPSHESYARAAFESVVGPAWLSSAERFEITELQSGVFLSQPQGRWAFSPLPRLAQLAPIFGMWAGDVTGDGAADLVFVGNSHAPRAAIGRFDGGLGGVLVGDRRGGFTLMPPDHSGFIVPFDGKALCGVDFNRDGWADFFATRNNDVSLAFRNRGNPLGRAFALHLRGANGNPTSVGAQARVTLADGTVQVLEVSAGSGYLSQSSPGLFFGYSPSAPPRSIQIRWPDGRTSEHPWHETPILLLETLPL